METPNVVVTESPPSVDPWCDDGSVSRAEPPWLRDQRIQHQKHRLEEQRQRLAQKYPASPTRGGEPNATSTSQPLRTATSQAAAAALRQATPVNPFDPFAQSESSSSSHQRRSSSNFPRQLRPLSPLEEKKESDLSARNRLRKIAFDPFQDPVPAFRSEIRKRKPYDSSTEGSNSSSAQRRRRIKQLERKTRPRIARPSATRSYRKNPKMLVYTCSTDQDSVTQDSLDQFLNTTDETALSSGREMEGEINSAGNSMGTTPSEKARKAAQALMESFQRPRNATDRGDGTPSTQSRSIASSSRYQTPPSDRPSVQTASPTRQPSRPIATPRSTPSQEYNSIAPSQTCSMPQHFSPCHTKSESQKMDRIVSPPQEERVTIVTPISHSTKRSSASTITPAASPQLPISPVGFPSLLSKTNGIPEEQEPVHDENEDVEVEKTTTQHANLALHDLIDEARTTDDVAWRNALYLLSIQPHLASQVEPECELTALHMCCMTLNVQEPPPHWMVRALLYTNPHQCQMEDSGGRLPLHLLAATSADAELMQMLVEEYPASVAHVDDHGFTPVLLLLKNDQVPLTLQHLRILLGQTARPAEPQKKHPIMQFRKGDHLKASFEDLQDLQAKQQKKHERIFDDYPDDVIQSLRKITQWKRRQVNRGLHPQNQLAMVFDNPATIAIPSTHQLPLHLLVRRKFQTPMNTIGSTKLTTKDTLVRVLIVAHPQSLLCTDVNGRTPLLTALLQADSLPDTATVELLLGKHAPGLASNPNHTPAQVASQETLQLPLHVAAEELAHNFEIISILVEAYPQAVQVQDFRGRTPLHCALQNYRSVPLDEATFGLLSLSNKENFEKVAKTMDDDGKRPLDLIVEHPDALKQWSSQEGRDTLHSFLNASMDPPRNPRESRVLLERIRMLPPWLRRAACASTYVQRTLLEELAGPLNTALVLLQAGTLVSLLLVLRIALEGEGIDFDSWVFVHYFCAYHLATQLIYWGAAFYLGEFYRMVFSNGWRWIDLLALCCSFAAASAVQSDITLLRKSLDTSLVDLSSFVPADDDEVVATLGAWATGLLWLSFVGFLVQWWCGMAVFLGLSFRIVRSLFWPFILGGMGIAAMAQILKTLEDCQHGNMCGVSDAYTMIYWMILGEPILGFEELSLLENTMSTSMVILLTVFTLLWLLWLLAVVAMTISEAQRLDLHDVALRWFWEPKVAFTVTPRPKLNETIIEKPTLSQRYCDSMELLWHVLSSSLKGGHHKQELYWYACWLRPGVVYFTRILACMILPIWFWLGVGTLGLLWPPQLRRWLFSTRSLSLCSRPKGPMEGQLTAAKLSHLKGEIEDYQSRSTSQTHNIQSDLTEIKHLLYRAMTEEVPSSDSF